MATPVARAWNLAKKLDNSQKLELMAMLIESVKATSEREQAQSEVKPALAPLPMKRYTKDEINAMIDQSERDIAEGRVYDFDEAMDELEREFAEEDRKLEMVEAV